MKKGKKKALKYGIHVGADKGSIKYTHQLILNIMKVDPKLSDSMVKVEALKTLKDCLEVKNVVVSNCIVKN